MTITESDAPVDLPIPDIVGRKTFDMVMKDAVARDKLWKFAASQGLGQNIEYLLKVRTECSVGFSNNKVTDFLH